MERLDAPAYNFALKMRRITAQYLLRTRDPKTSGGG